MHDSNDKLAPSEQQDDAKPVAATPTIYHRALLQYLKFQEAELWKWFSSTKARTDSSDAVRLELLKTTYRLDRHSAAEMYVIADDAAAKMGLTSSVTLYQAQQAIGLNASLAWLPGEAHIVLHGPVQDVLKPNEQHALLVHELAHHELQTISDGDYLVMEHILAAMISDQAATTSHDRTWRSHRLWTELYCDRRAAEITVDIESCVCALIKMETGLKDVSAAAYLDQADEVLANGLQGSDGVTHPEMFMRAKALQLWHDDASTCDDVIREMVQGPLKLGTMDLLQQREVQLLTEHLVRTFLQPKWLQTDLMLGHAHRFLDPQEVDHRPSAATLLKPRSLQTANPEGEVVEDVHQTFHNAVQRCDSQLKKFFCYMLLDFVTCDPDLEEAPLAAAFLFSQRAGLLGEFRVLVAEELKLGKRALISAETDAEKTVKLAEREFAQ